MPELTHCSIVVYAGQPVLTFKYEGDTRWRRFPLTEGGQRYCNPDVYDGPV